MTLQIRAKPKQGPEKFRKWDFWTGPFSPEKDFTDVELHLYECFGHLFDKYHFAIYGRDETEKKSRMQLIKEIN